MAQVKYNFKDDDGHKYMIPEDLLDDATVLLERIENAPFMSEEKWNAEDDFIEHFNHFMVG